MFAILLRVLGPAQHPDTAIRRSGFGPSLMFRLLCSQTGRGIWEHCALLVILVAAALPLLPSDGRDNGHPVSEYVRYQILCMKKISKFAFLPVAPYCIMY
jgi:hypothetical protein